MNLRILGLLIFGFLPSAASAQTLSTKLFVYAFEHGCLEFVSGNRGAAFVNLSRNFDLSYGEGLVEFRVSEDSERGTFTDIDGSKTEPNGEDVFSDIRGVLIIPADQSNEIAIDVAYPNDVNADEIDPTAPICQFGSEDIIRAWGDDLENFNNTNSTALNMGIENAIRNKFPASEVAKDEYGNVVSFQTMHGPMRISFGADANYLSVLIYRPKD